MAKSVCGKTWRVEEDMSLLQEAMTPCVIMDKTTAPDGYGGVVTMWSEGAAIDAAITPDGGTEQLVAFQRGWTGSYSVITKKSVVLMSGDVIKRKSDNMTFRIKSDGPDNKTPGSAALDARLVKAEGITL